jgi:hypothetical protein
MMREHALLRTRLVITLYLDATSRGGYGFVDRWSASVGKSMRGMSKGGHVDVFDEEIRDPTPVAQHTIVASPL